MRYLTIRNVPAELARRLEKEKETRGHSLNQTVLELLTASLGLGSAGRSNGLAELAGTWTAEETAELEAALCFTEEIDAELWR